MAPSYKLHYFNARGRGEAIRFLLAYGGVEYEDCRIDPANWPTTKGTMPFGVVPVLEVDGKKVHQTMAICRYLSKQFKLAGDNDWEAMEIDIVADTINDLAPTMSEYFKATRNPAATDETKAKLKAVVMNETIPFYLPRFEEIVKNNKGYFVNGKLTWADLYWASIMESTSAALAEDLLKDYPHLKAVKDRVFALPTIAEWVATRPKTTH